MFSTTSSAAPSPAMSAVVQGMPYRAASPVVSRVGNVDASVGIRPPVPNGPLTDIRQPEEIGATADPQVLGNRRLRAAVAYCVVKHQLFSNPEAAIHAADLEGIARDLKEVIRTGRISSVYTCNSLFHVRSLCDEAGSLYKALCVATIVISDNENPSLDMLSDERVHLAHVVTSAVLAADASGDCQDGSPGSAEVIGRLAACVTLYDAMRSLDQSLDSMSPAREFRQRLEEVRPYLQTCFDPAFKPNRFPVEPQWKAAMDSF